MTSVSRLIEADLETLIRGEPGAAVALPGLLDRATARPQDAQPERLANLVDLINFARQGAPIIKGTEPERPNCRECNNTRLLRLQQPLGLVGNSVQRTQALLPQSLSRKGQGKRGEGAGAGDSAPVLNTRAGGHQSCLTQTASRSASAKRTSCGSSLWRRHGGLRPWRETSACLGASVTRRPCSETRPWTMQGSWMS